MIKSTALLALLLPLSLRADIVINEIHYDPEPKTELAEFIELYNTGGESVDLSGYAFTNGFDFTFPEGSTIDAQAYLILAQNAQGYNGKFGSIFVGGLRAAGEFEAGNLSNDGERIVLRNPLGEVVDEVNYQANFPWPTAPQGEPIQANGDGVSMELLHPELDNNLGGSWRAGTKPTPGKENSIYQELNTIPPHIRQVAHSPQQPKSDEPVVITAKVTDPDGVASVLLDYQWVKPGEYIRITDAAYDSTWTDLEMKDDGVAPDEVADDGIYAVQMPDNLQVHRHLIRYRITINDSVGNELRVPYEDDPQPNFAYFVYDGVPAWKGAIDPGETPEISFPAETMNSIAVYHLIAVQSDAESIGYSAGQQIRRGTLVYDGEVYDHMIFTGRGRASRGQVGKEKWDFNFLRGHRFKGRDNYGRRYNVDWREINVLPGTNPWWGNNVSTDGTILNESVGFRIFQLIGSPASNTNFFQLRVIDDAAEAPSNQYNGDLWGLYIAIQDPDGRFLSERGLPDGNLYNWHGAGVKKNQGATSVENDSDYRAFTEILRNSTTLETWQAQLNFEAYYAFNCGNLIINNSDMRPGENMMSYIHPNGQTYPIPWDLDLTFEEAPHLGRGDTPAWENIYRVLSHDEVDIPYQNRIRELLSLLFNGQQSSMLVDEYSRFVWVDVPQGERVAVSSLVKNGGTAVATTATPHGFETGDQVTIDGASPAIYTGDKEVTKISDTEFSYRTNIFAPAPSGDAVIAFRTPDAKPLVLMDQAMWDNHPRKRKKDIYYENINSIESEDFNGYQAYMKRFLAPGGYGNDLLASHADEGAAPKTPEITYSGPDGFPVDALTFQTSAFASPSIFSQQSFAAVQWRIGETSDPAREDFDPTVPRVYEVNADWQSEEITPFQDTMTIPPDVPRPGRTYRVRARMKNTDGHWSAWSDPIQFVPSGPDIADYVSHLLVSEIMYHPLAPSEDERAQGWVESDFEFIEVHNNGDAALDLQYVRFTKGIDFDFAGSAITTIEPDGYVLVVSNQEAFESRYGTGLPVAGVYEDSQLSNGGERIKLSYGAGSPIRDFTYQDDEEWPQEADGDGQSLVVQGEPNADESYDLPAFWRASSERHGSPGRVDRPGVTGPSEFQQWLESHFNEQELLDDTIAGNNADPDGDRWANLFEFAFAGDPRMKDDLSPQIERSPNGISLTHGYSAAQELIYSYERSADLETWEAIEPTMADNGEQSRTVQLADDTSRFFRIRVTLR